MNKPNKHAEKMRQYTEEFILDSHAYRNWERRYEGDSANHWLVCNTHPKWDTDVEYRRKAKTITIGGIEVPEPMRVAPELGEWYYLPRVPYVPSCPSLRWDGDDNDWAALKQGMCHKTEAAALAHAKAMASLPAVGK